MGNISCILHCNDVFNADSARDDIIMNLDKNKSKDNPILLRMIASYLASLAEPISEYLEQIKDPTGIFSQLPIPDPDDWLEMYRRPSRLKRMTRSILVNFDKAEKWSKSFYSEIEKGMDELKLTDSQIEEFKKGINNAGLDVLSNMGDVDREKFKCSPEKLYAELDHTKKGYTFNLGGIVTEQLFFIKVFMPCYFMYNTYPIQLLRKARLGDIDALEKLIRLDSSIILDKRIAKIYHSSKTKKIINDRLNNSFGSNPNVKIDRKKIKMSLAGLISFYSDKIGQRLNESEIRKYFDEVAKSKGKGYIDVDIPDSPESFAKAIQRERRNWENALNNSRSFT